MKKLLSAFLIVAAFATAFSCSKIEEVKPVAGEVHTVSFNAISPATRTTFGTLSAGKFPTYWTANDSEIKVAQNISTGVAASVTKNSDTNASFTADFTDDGSGSYTFYAVSPASAVVSGVNKTYSSWTLEIPTTQTPLTTGPQESAMIMVAKSSTTNGSFPANVDLTFNHITAYVHMNITNLGLAVGDEVASVLVTANANIAYRYYYYVSGGSAGTLEASSGQTSITVLTNHADNIWFACAPMAVGTKLTISVTTKDSKVYTKNNITTPAALAAGHVASFDVNFAGITPPEDKVYNLVTSYSELTAGSKVIIAAVGSTAYAAGIGTTSDTYISAISQAKSSGNTKIISPAATVDIFTIEAGGTANTIALHGTNGYLFAKSDSRNQMGIQTTNDVNGYWTPTIVDALTGEMTLVATGSANHNHMRYNSNDSRFSCYTAGSSVTDLQALYKLEGSGSGPALVTTYTITYDGNGNTGGTAPSSVVTTGSFTVASVGDLEKSGYSFTGWNTATDGSGTPYTAGADAVATADMTLYAQWAAAGGGTKTYQHIFNAKPSTGNNVTLSGINWNISAVQLGSYNSANYAGVQIGTKSASGSITLTSSSSWSYESATKITEIRVWMNAGTGVPSAAVTIGGSAATSDGTVVTKNSSANSYEDATMVTYTPGTKDTGVVVIEVSTSTKAGYICAIEIDCK